MDPVTQVMLGSAVGYVVAGKEAPRRAVLTGAAIAVLPDLDVFFAYQNDLDAMTLHRGWTHSWFVHTLIAPLIAWVCWRWQKAIAFKTMLLMTWLVLITHSGLDALTVYGTQLFWPLTPPPVSGGSIFIIDPVYTLLLIVGFVAVVIRPRAPISGRIMRLTLFLSVLYLLWGMYAQQWISKQTEAALAVQNIDYQHYQVSATALNTLLWRMVVVTEDNYYEGYRSLLDGDAPLRWRRYDRGGELISELAENQSLSRINWFTQGLFKAEAQNGEVIITDLRMGMEPHYFFRFKIAEQNGRGWTPMIPEQISVQRDTRKGLQWVWSRLWDADVQPISDAGS